MNITFRKLISGVLAISICFSITRLMAIATPDNGYKSAVDNSGRALTDLPSYSQWLKKYSDAKAGQGTYRIDAAKYVSSKGTEMIRSEDGKEVLKTFGAGETLWSVNCDSAGFYNLTVMYLPIKSASGFSTSIEREITLNGETPYRECGRITFSRIYKDSGEIVEDEAGNDLRPVQEEREESRECTIRDSSGYVSEYLSFYLNEGENIIGFIGVKGDMIIEWLEFSSKLALISYEKYLEENDCNPNRSASVEPLLIQAESPYEKSDFTITYMNDRSSADTQPISASKIRLNTLGGNSWKMSGDWVSWRFDVKKEGYYSIILRCRQNFNPGTVSTRRLYIDGEIPFAEAENLQVKYNTDWQVTPLSKGETPLRFYFEPGEHTLTIEVTLGEMASVLESLKMALDSLNDDYLKILTYTGTSPDIYRNYYFKKLIPDVLEDFVVQKKSLENSLVALRELSGGSGQNTAVLEQIINILEKMINDSDTIAKYFLVFKDTLAALGTWITTYSEQPLLLDYIMIQPSEADMPKNGESFFRNLWLQIKVFLSSFMDVYDTTVYENKQEILTVWTSTGRDQSEIIQRLANESFQSGLSSKVRLNLVAVGSLLPNILADTPIDVYLSAGVSEPVNYAIRGAVLDLTDMDGFKDTVSRFHPAAMLPFTYKEHVYALPETLSFPMLFYRKDIFARQNLQPPQTWDQFYEIISIFQKNRMTVGINWLQAFTMFLYQNGGGYYNGELNASNLYSREGVLAFKQTTELYTTYGLPVQFDFPNRFRSGEMPMGIVDYTMYNQLTVFAPEIKGLWGFVPVPATTDEHGKTNGVSPATGLAVIMPRCVRNKEKAWEFMQWWTDAATQTKYGIEMETVLGPAAKQPSANLQAVKNLPWMAEEVKAIEAQWNNLAGTPEIPGSYYTVRMLDFAFNSVYSSGIGPSDALEENAMELDEEIVRKLKEFDKIGQN